MKKIMFNDKYGLTQAVLEGRKTMTRRIMKPQPTWVSGDGKIFDDSKPPRYKVGEVIAIAQKYKDLPNPFAGRGTTWRDAAGWENKMFVEAELMPHQIRITNVRVERLQDISDEDCLKEGVLRVPKVDHHFNKTFYYTFEGAGEDVLFYTPKGAFAALIGKISGKGTLESNPWVFVYSFELVK